MENRHVVAKRPKTFEGHSSLALRSWPFPPDRPAHPIITKLHLTPLTTTKASSPQPIYSILLYRPLIPIRLHSASDSVFQPPLYSEKT